MKFSLIILIVMLASCSRAVGQFPPYSDPGDVADPLPVHLKTHHPSFNLLSHGQERS